MKSNIDLGLMIIENNGQVYLSIYNNVTLFCDFFFLVFML